MSFVGALKALVRQVAGGRTGSRRGPVELQQQVSYELEINGYLWM